MDQLRRIRFCRALDRNIRIFHPDPCRLIAANTGHSARNAIDCTLVAMSVVSHRNQREQREGISANRALQLFLHQLRDETDNHYHSLHATIVRPNAYSCSTPRCHYRHYYWKTQVKTLWIDQQYPDRLNSVWQVDTDQKRRQKSTRPGWE